LYGYPWADPAAAMVVGALIGGIGIQTCYKSLQVN